MSIYKMNDKIVLKMKEDNELGQGRKMDASDFGAGSKLPGVTSFSYRVNPESTIFQISREINPPASEAIMSLLSIVPAVRDCRYS